MRTARLFVLFTRAALSLAVLVALGWSAIAFAQTPAPVAPAVDGINLDTILGMVIKAVGVLIALLLLPKVRAFLSAHAADKNASALDTQLWTIADKAEHFTELAIAAVAPTLQADLAANKPIGDVALNAAKSVEGYLGTAGVAELGEVMNLGVGLVTKYLQDLAAKKVADAQAAGAAAAAAITTGQAAVAAINMKGA